MQMIKADDQQIVTHSLQQKEEILSIGFFKVLGYFSEIFRFNFFIPASIPEVEILCFLVLKVLVYFQR